MLEVRTALGIIDSISRPTDGVYDLKICNFVYCFSGHHFVQNLKFFFIRAP